MSSLQKRTPILTCTLVLMLLGLASLSCNLPAGLQAKLFGSGTQTPPAMPTSTPQPLPPEIVETNPRLGSTISLEGSITFFFNQKMDQESINNGLSLTPDIAGSLNWLDPATLQFIPLEPLPHGEEIIFAFESTIMAANGIQSPGEQIVSFLTADLLRPVTFLPSPFSLEVDPLSAILVTFNQPVVPLGEDLLSGPNPLSINPQPGGRGEWINSSTYQLIPDPGLSGGITYQVEISPELISSAGTGLVEDSPLSWFFTTADPQILDWKPYEGDRGVHLDGTIQFSFNQAMDRDDIEANFTLLDGDGERVSGQFVWEENSREVEFVPDQLLKRDANYAFHLPEEVTSAGGTPLGSDIKISFQTSEDFQFLGTPSGQSYTTTIYEGVRLYFNNPVDLAAVEENITIFPEISDFWPASGGNGNVLNIYGSFDPLTDYSLVMSGSLADIWGSELGAAHSLNFTTEPLPPNLTVTEGNSILFLTGEENAIPAQAANLYRVSLSLGSIPADAVPLFFGPGLYTNLEEYFPGDIQRWTEIINVPGDDSYTVNLPLTRDGRKLAPGLYRYQIYSQELPYNPSPYLLAVSNIHLTMKASPENVLIWALDLRTGEQVADAEIRIYDHNGAEVFSGTTNQEGIYQAEFSAPIDLYDRVFYAMTGSAGEDDFGITASNWAYGAEPFNYGITADYGTPQPQSYLYTDRPIYRPGQTVHYRVIHRDRLAGEYVLPDEDQINLAFYQAGQEEERISLPLSEFGTAEGEIQLSAFAEPGYYRLETEYGMTLFQVAEYIKPEIDLEVLLNDDEGLAGDTWVGSVDARYYFDAPASEVDLSWFLQAEPAPFILPGYQTGLIGSNWFAFPSPYFQGSRIAEGRGQTDMEGQWEMEGFLTEVDMYDQEVSLPAVFRFVVTAQDETGFQVTNQDSMFVHPSDFYIGVDPSAWMVESGQEVEFDILVVDWDQDPDGEHDLQADFYKVEWNYEVGEVGQIEYFREIELVAEIEFSTDFSGKAKIGFVPEEPGTYQLDISGDGARTEVMLWVGGPGATVWPTQTNQKIQLIADKQHYQPGEEARVFIPNPFSEGAQALITIERHKVLSYQTLSISDSGETVTLSLGEDDAPNIYLSVTLIGRDTEGKMNFRQGYLNLLVDPSENILDVEVIGEPERLGPGEEIGFTIRITDQDGDPQVGEFSLAVVDQAVLALSDPYAPNIEEAFYGVQPLAVRLGFPLGMHAGRLVYVPGGMGGGGGDLVDSVRDQFQDTGFWQADVVTDENGEARVRFMMPDNLTTWQAQARGVTQDTAVGQTSTEIVTTKDLLIRPVTPRFLVAGDHLPLAAVVHNNTDKNLTVDVSLLGSGLTLDDPDFSTQTVEIAAGARTRVEWWGTAAEADQADLLFTADAGDYTDAVKPYLGPLPIIRYLAPINFGTSGVLETAGQELEIVSLPRSFDPGEGSLEIELAPSLAASIMTALEVLEERENFSNEEVLSNFLPNVITYQTLQELDLEYPQLEGRLDGLIGDTLEALEAAQNDDGGWGWWQHGSSEQELTSYMLFGLVRAQYAGIFVDDLMVQRAIGYLMATLPSVDMLVDPWQYNSLAMRYFALTEAGIDVHAGMEELALVESLLDPGYRALLAAALEESEPGNGTTRSLLSNLVGQGIRSATGLHWENQPESRSWFNSSITTSAMAVYGLARVEDSPAVLPEAARYLVSAKNWQGDWWSAFETSWAILALNEVIRSSADLSGGFDYSAAVNGRELINGAVEGPAQLETASASVPISDLYTEDPNALEIGRSEGEGSLYYTAHLLAYRPAQDAEPFGRGLSISRAYRKAAEEAIHFVDSGAAGDLVQVQLTLVVEHDTHYVMIEDYIPAGAEILDTRLKTSRQDLEDYHGSAPFQEGWGWWYFEAPRIYDERVTWAARTLPAGTYQLTYVLSLTHPGEFQVLPSRAWGIYHPETMAVSAGDNFLIEPVN